MKFCEYLLADIPLELPLFFACQEARAVALTWIRKQEGVRIRCMDGEVVISTSFDPSRDVLCISPTAIHGFNQDPYDGWVADLDDRQIHGSASSVKNFAIHAGMLDDLQDVNHLGQILVSNYINVSVI